MTFSQKQITCRFILGQGNFGLDGADTIDMSNFRMSIALAMAGGRAMGTCDARIWGMSLDDMNKLSTMQIVDTAQRKNILKVMAGDSTFAVDQLPVAFQGTITSAWADFNSQPNVPFIVAANQLAFEALAPAQPTSVRGAADVAGLLAGLATQMNLSFENNGVNQKLPGGYYWGSARQQALAIVRDAKIQWNSGDNGTLAIWPMGAARTSMPPVQLVAGIDTIGYPSLTPTGISLRMLYNATLGVGQLINLSSSLVSRANGQWSVNRIDHVIEALMPGGKWETHILCNKLGTTVANTQPGIQG